MPKTALKESEIKNLKTVSQDEFNRIVDALYQNPKPDYKNIPHIIKLPEIKAILAAKLGIQNSNFFLRTGIAHVRPQRKGGYGQSLRIDEMKGLLDFLKNCGTAYIDTNKKHQNFFLAGLDENDRTKANKVVFNKDKLGNYIVTIGKVATKNLNEQEYTEVAVGLGPTIWSAYKKRSPATMLRPSTTSANQNISQTQNLSNQDGSQSVVSEKEIQNLRNLKNPDAVAIFKNEKFFSAYGKTFIPYRKFESEKEKQLVDSLSTSENMPVKISKNADKYAYTLNNFKNYTAEYGDDIFYCIDDKRFCTPYRDGLRNLNVSKLRKIYATELLNFKKENLDLISYLEKRNLEAELRRNELEYGLQKTATKIQTIPFSPENYDKLFNRAQLESPIEHIKLGGNQFEKLKNKHREKYLFLVYETLTRPSLVINELRIQSNGEELSHNYIKSFVDENNVDGFQSVVVKIDSDNVSVTSHKRDLKNLVGKIIMPEQLVFVRPEVRQMVEQRTQKEQSIVNPTRSFTSNNNTAYSTYISEPSNQYYDEEKILSINDLNLTVSESNQSYQKSSLNKNKNPKEKSMANENKIASRIDPKTYRFQNGMSIDDIALLGNYTRSEAVEKITQGNSAIENLPYFTDAEKKIIEGVKNSTLAPDAKACMVDNVERYIAASHWNPETQTFSDEPSRMVLNWPYEIPQELDRHFMDVYNSKRFTAAADFSLGLHEDVPQLAVDDYTVSKRQAKESEETRDKIISEVLSGEKSGMYTAFKKFSEHGVFDIRNEKVELSNGTITENGWKQLRAAMEIYRNKRFETTRYVFIDKETGRVKDQIALSSHLPNVSVVSEDNNKTLMQVISRAKETNCVVAMAHNHPSGNVKQSIDDMKTTAEIEKLFKTNGGEQLFAGHIILDHENFNLYTPGKGWNQEEIEKPHKDELEKENKAGWENKYIGSTEALKNVALSDVARAINESQNYSDDFIPIAFADTQLKMSGVQFFHKSFFEKEPEFIKEELELAGRQAGATRAFPVFTEHYLKELDPIQKIELDKKLRSCISHNAFCDACVGKEVVSEKYVIEPGNAYFSSVSADKVVPEVHATWNTEKHPVDENLFRKMTEDDLPQRKVAEKGEEFKQLENDDYIHSEEFISKFGDWEKVNRLEKIKKAKPLEKDDKVFSSGKDITKTVERLVKDGDRKSIQAIEKELGKNITGTYVNKDTGLRINVSNRNVIEISNHNYLQKEHIQAIQYIPEIIDKAIYIGDVENEDKSKHPNIQKYKYLVTGLSIKGTDFTCKTVVGVDKSGNCYYDQSLSTIEKGKLIDIIQEKNKLGNLSPLITQRESELSESHSPYVYYDKRLINICQVPQMPYLEMVDGKWQPKPETIQDVKNGKLFLEKKGQISVFHDSSTAIFESQNKSVVSENNQTYQKSAKQTMEDKTMENEPVVNTGTLDETIAEDKTTSDEKTELDPEATDIDEDAQKIAPEDNFTFLDDETAQKLEPETIDVADFDAPAFDETSVDLSEVAEAQEKAEKTESENKGVNSIVSQKLHNSENKKYNAARNNLRTKEDLENSKYLENLKKEIEQLKKENARLSEKVEKLEKQNAQLMNKAKVTDERTEKEKAAAEKNQEKSAAFAPNSIAELNNKIRTLQKENSALKEGNSSLKKENEQIKKANKWYKNAMYKSAKVEVNGVVRECKEGLVKGFKNAVSSLDKVRKDNIHLAFENKSLKTMAAENQMEAILER